MPIFFIIAGFVLLVSGVRGTTKQLFTLFASDAKAFMSWFFLIVIIGLIGVSKSARPLSNAFLVLIIVTFFLKNGSAVISNVQTTISTGGTAPAPVSTTATTPVVTGTSNFSSSGATNYLYNTGGSTTNSTSPTLASATMWNSAVNSYFA